MKYVYSIQLQFRRFIANAEHASNLNLWKTFPLEILA
jgi:hypothetical protein